jgi:transcriptional regulator with XRE-family HTH domain
MRPRFFHDATVPTLRPRRSARAVIEGPKSASNCSEESLTIGALCNLQTSGVKPNFANCGWTGVSCAGPWGMPKTKHPNHLRAWREFRKMTQEQLAEAIGTTAPVVSLLESGDRSLSLKWLLRLAPALRTTPGILLDHDPNTLDTDVLEIWARVPDSVKPQAQEILRTFTRKNRA